MLLFTCKNRRLNKCFILILILYSYSYSNTVLSMYEINALYNSKLALATN